MRPTLGLALGSGLGLVSPGGRVSTGRELVLVVIYEVLHSPFSKSSASLAALQCAPGSQHCLACSEVT